MTTTMAATWMCYRNFCLKICFVFTFLKYSWGNRVLEKMYEEVQGDMACFKIFNGTHEIGCTSNFWGNVGVVHLIENMSNFNWFLKHGPHPPYVLALIPELFTKDILVSASDSGKLSGVLLLNSENYSRPSQFSGGQNCPNGDSSLYANSSLSEYCDSNPWNPLGSSLLYMSWNFPIFLIDDDESIDTIISCFNKFNKPLENEEPRDWPLCAIELQSNMYATTNSEVCLRRSQSLLLGPDINLCEPLEDINIWGSVKPFNISNEVNKNSIYIVSASTDASSLFDNISPGANVAVSGLVTLLVTAEALFRYQKDFTFNNGKNVIFVLYEGESWDYIGSSRMIYDMNQSNFPYEYIEGQTDQLNNLNLSHIDSIIDLKQLGQISKENGVKNVYIHTDPISNSAEERVHNKTQKLIKLLLIESEHSDINFKKTDSNVPLPPSSFQSFLKSRNIPGIALADHDQHFENKYYHSIYDTYVNVNFSSSINNTDENDQLHKDIAQVAGVIASSLYQLLTGKQKHIKADADITNELLFCYLRNTNCTFFQENSDSSLLKFLHPKPAKMFVSVKRGENYLSYLSGRVLSRFLGKIVDLNETECKTNNTQIMNLVFFPYLDSANGTCYESTMHHSSALSPAFIIDGYDWHSNEYSTWTQSTWQKSEARIFLLPSQFEEIGLILGGVISVLLSVSVVYFLNSRASLIFISEVLPAPC